MDEIKVGDKVLIDYYGFAFNGIVTSINGNIVKGEITPPMSKFSAPKYVVFPTNIEQSKHLLELGLDPKTADMY